MKSDPDQQHDENRDFMMNTEADVIPT